MKLVSLGVSGKRNLKRVNVLSNGDKMISIITRAGSDAEPAIFDLYLCIRNQFDLDFEWIILVRPSYKFDSGGLKLRLDSDPILKSRTKIIFASTNSRGELLNIGLRVVKGSHFVVVDDDDLVVSNFTQQLNLAALEAPKAILRTIPSRKVVRDLSNFPGNLISLSKCEFLWPDKFDPHQHLYSNQTPCLSLAFPTYIAKINSLSWDSDLVAVEDWDFLLSFLRKAKVLQLPVATSIYRQRKRTTRSRKSVRVTDWKGAESTVRLRIPQYLLEIEKMQISPATQNFETYKHREYSQFTIYIANKLQKFPFLFDISRRIFFFLRVKNA
jgi:hypothetical protein